MLSQQERAGATAALTAYQRAIDGIRANENLSVAGKRRAMRAETIAVRDALKSLRAAADARTAQRRRDLEHRLFGLGSRTSGSDAISHRDAQDRADACKTPGEARRLLARAEQAGDVVLARAVFQSAWDRVSDAQPGWAELGRAYLEHRPGDNEAAAELAGLMNGTASTAERLADSMYTRLTLPPELEGPAGNNLDALAAEAAPQPAGRI